MDVMSWLKELVSEDETVSSKRLTAMISFALIVVITLVNLFLGNTVAPFIYDGLIYVYMSGLGLTSIEKIFQPSRSGRKSTKKIEIEDSTQVFEKE